MTLSFRLSRKGAAWLGGVPSLGAILYFIAGFMLRVAPDAPPEFVPTDHSVNVPVSRILVPVDVQAGALAKLVKKQLASKPLVQGTSTKLISEAVFKVIDLPPEARRCDPVTVVKRVVEEVSCDKLDKGFFKAVGSIGECVWNNTGGRVVRVTRDVVVNSVECTQLDKLVAQISPVPELAYSVRLKNLAIAGNSDGSLRVSTKSTAELRLQTQGKVLRGIDWIKTQKCQVPVSVMAQADVTVAVKDDALFIEPDIGKVSFDLDKGACSLGFVDHIDLDGLGGLFKSEIGRAITPALRNALIGAVDETTDDPIASAQVTQALGQARQLLAKPVQLPTAPPVWIGLDARELLVSPNVQAQRGKGDLIRVAGGFTSKPTIQLSEPAGGSTQVPIRVEDSEVRGFHLVPTAHVPLPLIEATANQAVQAFLNEKAPYLKFGDLNVHAYQNADRLVLGISLKNVSFFRVSVEVFVTAKPVFDAQENVIYLDDLKLDVESSEEMVRRVGWYAEGALEAALAPFMRFEVDPHFKQIVDTLKDFRVQSDDGLAQLQISLDDLRLETFWLDGNTLNAAVSANGTAGVAVDLSKLP